MLIAVIILGSGYLVYSFVALAPEITEVIEVNEEKVIQERKKEITKDDS